MILKRESRPNLFTLKEQSEEFFQFLMQGTENIKHEIYLAELAELMQIHNAAMKEVSTKLEVLADDFQLTHRHNPIHHLECRLKSFQSLINKLKKYEESASLDSIRKNVKDIAGIRVICNFIDDIYEIEKLLLNQPDVKLIKRRDYIESPKDNGYRSLHIVVDVPIYLSNEMKRVPVEIQLRTIAMDYWASLEHMLKYKNENSKAEKYSNILLDCSFALENVEKAMEQVREYIEA